MDFCSGIHVGCGVYIGTAVHIGADACVPQAVPMIPETNKTVTNGRAGIYRHSVFIAHSPHLSGFRGIG